MILCIGTTPAAQRVMVFRKLVPGSVNRAATTLDGAAGKAVNVAKVLHSLGEQPTLITFLGGDRGQELGNSIAARGIEMLVVKVDSRTRQCITIIDESTGTQTELVEESRPVQSAAYHEMLNLIGGRASNCRAMVLSGTLTPGAPPDFYAQCIRLAEGARALTVLDAQGPPLIHALDARPGLVKPNRAELAATVGRELSDESTLRSAMRELAERGAQQVVVTAGPEPALAFDGKCFWRVRSPRIDALNPIGSGDAFTAGLVSRLVRGDDLGESVRWAAAAGAANALTLMAGELEREQVERLAAGATVEQIP